MPLWGKTDNTAGEPKFTSHHEGMDSSNFTMYGVCLLYTSDAADE